MRLIDADALETMLGDWIRNHWTDAFTGDDAGSEFADIIDHAETIEQSPIVHAHWEAKYNPEELSGDTLCKCSNCGEEEPICFISDWNFCPYCGAKMDEDEL